MSLLQEIHSDLKTQEDLKSLEEAGLIKKGLGKAASAIGMKGTAANLQARGEADQKIKQLKIAFQQFAGQMGKKMNDASANDLATFLKSKNLPVAEEIRRMGNSPLNQIDKQAINKAFQVAIQGGAKRALRQQVGQSGQPQQTSQQQGVGGKIQQFISSLTPVQKNSLIAALQSS